MTAEQKHRHKLVVFLSLAGLFSGLLTICVSYLHGSFRFNFFQGALFGALISCCLAILGRLHSFWKAVWLFAIVTAAYAISILVAIGVQGVFSPPGMGRHSTASPVALFAGGTVGSFLVLGGALRLLGSEGVGSAPIRRALFWSPVGGLVGVIGWEMGPALGVAIWPTLRALHLAVPPQAFQDTREEAARMFSLFAVWQTGMGFILGMLLRRHEMKTQAKESEHP